MQKIARLINRELNWLSFNERVLQESLDRKNPLVERLRFLGIYSNNMDEFFRVRVANINRMISMRKSFLEGFDGTPKQLMSQIQDTVRKQRKIYDLSYQRLLKNLEAHRIYHLNEHTVTPSIKAKLETYYHNDLKQDIVPILLDKKRKFPRLQDKEIYLAVTLVGAKKDKPLYALIQIPSSHNRFITFKEPEGSFVIILDDVIRLYLKQIFTIFEFDEAHAFTFKFTRDAELNIDDDFSVSIYDKMEEGIKQRKKGEPVRFVYDAEMDKELLNYLLKALGTSEYDHIAPSGRYHNFKDLMRFPDFGNGAFVFKPRPPLNHPLLTEERSLLKTILKQDVLLHYPYQKFDHLVDFLREAAIDPKVKEIKINIYRVAKRSQVINALINAIKNGKEVTVVVELQARFDEENNMYWSNLLREHGARIIFGVPGLKVHSKMIQVTRVSGKKEQLLTHVGTGNFHGGTAKVYTDFSLFTSNPEITREVKKVFNLLENNIERGIYRQLFVSPFNTRRRFQQLINQEIKNAKAGKNAEIRIVLNNLVDSKLINKLYAAGKVGVKIRIIVRGICCINPELPELKGNVLVKSIIGRHLEHTRYFIFENDNNPLYFISSADWMTRNLDKRIEVTAPILQDNIKEQLREVFEIQWSDNVKARWIDEKQNNRFVKPEIDGELIESQAALYAYYESKLQ